MKECDILGGRLKHTLTPPTYIFKGVRTPRNPPGSTPQKWLQVACPKGHLSEMELCKFRNLTLNPTLNHNLNHNSNPNLIPNPMPIRFGQMTLSPLKLCVWTPTSSYS